MNPPASSRWWFSFPDFTVRLVEGGTEHGDLKEVTAFVKENRGLELVGGKEYLILNYRDNRITTYYAAGKGGAHFVTYIAGEDGKVISTQFLHFEDAVQSFAGKTRLTLLATAPKQKKRAGRRFRSWLLHRLLNDRRLEEMTS